MMDMKDKQIADLRVMGSKSITNIGHIVGLSHSRVSKRLQKKEVQEYIESLQRRLMKETLPGAFDNVNTAIGVYLHTEDQQMREHGFRASMEVLKAASILPSPTPSVFIQNLQQNNIMSPIVAEVLKKHFMGMTAPIDMNEEGEENAGEDQEEGQGEV